MMYDVTSRRSFESVETYFQQFEQNTKDHVVAVLVGCKVDLALRRREVSHEEGVELAERFSATLQRGIVPFVETSAKTGEGIEKAMCKLLLATRRRRQCLGAAAPEQHITQPRIVSTPPKPNCKCSIA